MAIALVSPSPYKVTTGALTRIDFDFTSGDIVAGNLLVVVISKDDDVAASAPAGWTNLLGVESDNQMWLDIFYKEAVSADETETQYRFTTDNESKAGILYQFSGVDTTPILLSSTSDIGSGTAPATAAFTGNDAGSWIIAGFGSDEDDAVTLASNVDTTDWEIASVANNNAASLAIGRDVPGSTSVPAYNHTIAASQEWVAFVVEVKPAAGGAAYTLDATTGAFAFTGTASAGQKLAAKIDGAAGAFAFAGTESVGQKLAAKIDGATGAFAFAGTDATFDVTRNPSITAGSGGFDFNGTDATLVFAGASQNYTLDAAAGSFAFSGTDATFDVTRNYQLTGSSGAFAFTGTAVTDLRVEITTQVTTGGFAFEGTDSTLSLANNYTLTADSGAFAFDGTVATVGPTYNYNLTADSGAFAFDGTAAALESVFTYEVIADAGSFAFSGSDATLTPSIASAASIVADTGAFAFAGTDATLTANVVSIVPPGTGGGGGEIDGDAWRHLDKDHRREEERRRKALARAIREAREEAERLAAATTQPPFAPTQLVTALTQVMSAAPATTDIAAYLAAENARRLEAERIRLEQEEEEAIMVMVAMLAAA